MSPIARAQHLPKTYRNTNTANRMTRAVVHANVTGKRFAQINVSEALRQQHELASGNGLRASDGGWIILEDFIESILRQISRLG